MCVIMGKKDDAITDNTACKIAPNNPRVTSLFKYYQCRLSAFNQI